MISFSSNLYAWNHRAQLLSDDCWLVENREQLSFIPLANEGIVLEIMGGCTVEMRTRSPELKAVTGITVISFDKKGVGGGEPKPLHSWSWCTLSLTIDQVRQPKYTLTIYDLIAQED